MDKREKGLALLDLNDLQKNGFAGLPIEVIILQTHVHGKILRKLVGTVCILLIFLLVFSNRGAPHCGPDLGEIFFNILILWSQMVV